MIECIFTTKSEKIHGGLKLKKYHYGKNQQNICQCEIVLKSESKKIGHLFCSITQILSILVLKNNNKGQNSLFLALKWGIARLCRSNSFRDTAINVKTLDFYFFSFCKIWLIFYTKSWKFHIIELFLLVISLEPFEVERRTISHFEAWNKLFWPLFIQKYSEGSQYQIISKRKCPIFFDSDFSTVQTCALSTFMHPAAQ